MERERATKFIHELLDLLVKQKGSDLFITAGFPPAIKVDGRISPVSKTGLDAAAHDGARAQRDERQAGGRVRVDEGVQLRHRAARRGPLPRQRVRAAGSHRHGAAHDHDRHPEVRGARPAAGAEGRHHVEARHHDVRRRDGSGKSTSMASLLGYRNQNSYGHIITIEDPIEFVHEHRNCVITQREVGVDTDDWQIALKNTLRQAPDVILIGEVRERETMDYAIAVRGNRPPVPCDAARQQHEPGARPRDQLLPRGPPRPAADGPVRSTFARSWRSGSSRAATAAAACRRSR
jgi:twitching motility protein PilU